MNNGNYRQLEVALAADHGLVAHMHSGLSAVEHRPADVVAQPLIIQDQLADRVRELVALPAALAPPGALTLAFRSGGTRRLDRVSGRSELVRGDVRHRRGLTGSMG